MFFIIFMLSKFQNQNQFLMVLILLINIFYFIFFIENNFSNLPEQDDMCPICYNPFHIKVRPNSCFHFYCLRCTKIEQNICTFCEIVIIITSWYIDDNDYGNRLP